MSVEESAATAVAVLFAVLALVQVANFRLTHFRVYLLSGLSALFRTVGYSLRAQYFSDVASGNPNTNYVAAFTVFLMAGFAISYAVLILVMGCWFKNAAPLRSMRRSIGVRWIIMPIVVAGPIMGIAITVLRYAYPTPDNLSTANQMREAALWITMSCAVLLTAIIAAATVAAMKNSLPRSHDRLIAVGLIAVLLMDIAAIFNVVSLYHPQYTTNPNLWYPLIAMPPLIELCIISWPRLLPRVALGSRYDAWVAEQSGSSASSDEKPPSMPSYKSPQSSGELKGEDSV